MSASSECFAAVISDAPGFESRWRDVLARWEPEYPGDYNAMLEFASYLVEQYQVGDTSCFAAVFAKVEHCAQSGDWEVLNLISVGLFENIQNLSSHRPIGQAVFLRWLGPKSRQLWDNMNEVWAELAELERQGRLVEKAPWWQFWRRSRSMVANGTSLDTMLQNVTNPDLRRIIESMHRRRR